MSYCGKLTLGLDISTSITGLSIVDEQESVVFSTYIDTRNKNKFSSLYEKAEFIKNKLAEIEDTYCISSICIEQSLQSFRSGFSSAKTLSTLSRFNGIVSWLCWDIFSLEPEMIAASSARKVAGASIKRGENTKEKILQFIVDKYPQISIRYTKHGNPKPGTYDLCDSIIIALAGSKNGRKN
jgi:Holliday junction resolvasome RuvABC endonuclease subunit